MSILMLPRQIMKLPEESLRVPSSRSEVLTSGTFCQPPVRWLKRPYKPYLTVCVAPGPAKPFQVLQIHHMSKDVTRCHKGVKGVILQFLHRMGLRSGTVLCQRYGSEMGRKRWRALGLGGYGWPQIASHSWKGSIQTRADQRWPELTRADQLGILRKGETPNISQL